MVACINAGALQIINVIDIYIQERLAAGLPTNIGNICLIKID